MPLSEFQDNLEEKGYKTTRMYKEDDLSDWYLRVTLDEEEASVVRFGKTDEPPYIVVCPTEPHTEEGTQLLEEWLQKKKKHMKDVAGDPEVFTRPDRFMTEDCDNDNLPTTKTLIPNPPTWMKSVFTRRDRFMTEDCDNDDDMPPPLMPCPYHPEENGDDNLLPMPRPLTRMQTTVADDTDSPLPIRRQCSNVFGGLV